MTLGCHVDAGRSARTLQMGAVREGPCRIHLDNWPATSVGGDTGMADAAFVWACVHPLVANVGVMPMLRMSWAVAVRPGVLPDFCLILPSVSLLSSCVPSKGAANGPYVVHLRICLHMRCLHPG